MGDGGNELCNAFVDGVDGSGLRHSHPVLHLGEDLLDGVEVRGVGRQECEPRAHVEDRRADGARSMATEIVEHHDVARPEGWHQELLDVAAEDGPVDRPIDDAGLCQRIDPERCKKREGAPASVGREAEQALALLAPAADRRYVGLDPGLVDDDEAGGIEMTPRAQPALAPPNDIGALLLNREECFF